MTMDRAVFRLPVPSGRICRAMVTGAGLWLAAACMGPFSGAWATEDARPSPAELRIITQRITALPARERPGVMGQDMAWRMTTFLCQDAARGVLVRRGALPHRFFLQDDRPNSQVVVSPALIEGRGQYLPARNSLRWVAFAWSCHLDPATGHVVHFDVNPVARQDKGP